MDIPTPINYSNELTKYALLKILLAGDNVYSYFPLNPYSFTMEDSNKFITRHINNNVYLSYSPNLKKYYDMIQSEIPVLFVNYSVVLDFKYYGTTKPQDRDINNQIEDWKNGYMWARVKLPNNTITEEKLREIENKVGIKIERGYYWVKYLAKLIYFPKDLYNINRGVIKLYYSIPSPLATIPYIKDIYQAITHEKEKIIQNAKNLLNAIGFTIDNSLIYYIGAVPKQGIYIDVKDGSYIVYAPVVKKTTAQMIQYLIIGAIILAAIAFSVSCYFIYKAEVYYKEAESEKTKRTEVVMKTITNPDVLKTLSNNPEALKAFLQLTGDINNKGMDFVGLIEEAAYYSFIGLAGLVGLYILIKALRD